MLSRRTFLKLFGIASLSFSIFPSIYVKDTCSQPLVDKRGRSKVKNWLYGSPRRGCSTPDLAFESQGKRAAGFRDFAEKFL
jgi:hypothetical protein